MKNAVLLTLFVLSTSVFAHSGRTDKHGCHHVTATGEYHCHHDGSSSWDGISPSTSGNNPLIDDGNHVQKDFDMFGDVRYNYSYSTQYQVSVYNRTIKPTYGVFVGETYTLKITAKSYNSSVLIKFNSKPKYNFIIDSIEQVPIVEVGYSTNYNTKTTFTIKWTPRIEDIGKKINISYYAIEINKPNKLKSKTHVIKNIRILANASDYLLYGYNTYSESKDKIIQLNDIYSMYEKHTMEACDLISSDITSPIPNNIKSNDSLNIQTIAVYNTTIYNIYKKTIQNGYIIERGVPNSNLPLLKYDVTFYENECYIFKR